MKKPINQGKDKRLERKEWQKDAEWETVVKSTAATVTARIICQAASK